MILSYSHKSKTFDKIRERRGKIMKTKKLIFAALFAALTCVATMIIKVPTPTMGYIHPGDSIVLLSGFLLGPLYGGLAAGIGSMFSDLFGGYFSYAPATFVIKMLTAVFASLVYRAFTKKLSEVSGGKQAAFTAISGVVGEAFMVFGYFVFEIFLMALAAGDGFSSTSLAAGLASSASGVPFNIVQGLFGVILSTILYPLLKKPLAQYSK